MKESPASSETWLPEYGECFFFGVYFGVHETKACVLHYANSFTRENITYQWPDNSRKFKFTQPQGVVNVGDFTATAYFQAIRDLIGAKVKEYTYIDGISVSFAFLPLNLSPDALHAKLTEYVYQNKRPGMNPKTPHKPGVFVREEFRLWERLVLSMVGTKMDRKRRLDAPVKINSNFAMLYSDSHFFYFHKGFTVRGNGIPGEIGTIEPMGLRAVEHLYQVRNREDAYELERNEVYQKAKELFEVDEFDELMEKIRHHYDVFKITQLAGLMTDPQFDEDYAKAGYNILTDFWSKLDDKLRQSGGSIHIVLVGRVFSSKFAEFTRLFAREEPEKWERMVFYKCKNTMMNDPEVTAGFLSIQTIKGHQLELDELEKPVPPAPIAPAPAHLARGAAA